MDLIRDEGNPIQRQLKVQSIFSNLDLCEEERISYSEFIIGALDPDVHLTKSNIYSLFKYMDVFGQDFLNTDGMKLVFSRTGRQATSQFIQKMFYEVEDIIGSNAS